MERIDSDERMSQRKTKLRYAETFKNSAVGTKDAHGEGEGEVGLERSTGEDGGPYMPG